jgi:hypothetical protein
MTIFISAKHGPDDGRHRPKVWAPWKNADSRQECEAMAAQKFARESGRIKPGDPPLMVTIYSSETDPAQPPAIINFTTFKIHP